MMLVLIVAVFFSLPPVRPQWGLPVQCPVGPTSKARLCPIRSELRSIARKEHTVEISNPARICYKFDLRARCLIRGVCSTLRSECFARGVEHSPHSLQFKLSHQSMQHLQRGEIAHRPGVDHGRWIIEIVRCPGEMLTVRLQTSIGERLQRQPEIP